MHYARRRKMTRCESVIVNSRRLPIVQGATFAFLAPVFSILNLPKWKCPGEYISHVNYMQILCIDIGSRREDKTNVSFQVGFCTENYENLYTYPGWWHSIREKPQSLD